MEVEERKIIRDLTHDIQVQQLAARKNCRRIIYGLLVASWGFLVNSNCLTERLALSVIFLVGVVYLMVETWCYFSIAKKGRKLYSTKDKLSDNDIENEMTKQSEKSFLVLHGQLYVCLIMGFVLAITIVFDLLNK